MAFNSGAISTAAATGVDLRWGAVQTSTVNFGEVWVGVEVVADSPITQDVIVNVSSATPDVGVAGMPSGPPVHQSIVEWFDVRALSQTPKDAELTFTIVVPATDPNPANNAPLIITVDLGNRRDLGIRLTTVEHGQIRTSTEPVDLYLRYDIFNTNAARDTARFRFNLPDTTTYVSANGGNQFACPPPAGTTLRCDPLTAGGIVKGFMFPVDVHLKALPGTALELRAEVTYDGPPDMPADVDPSNNTSVTAYQVPAAAPGRSAPPAKAPVLEPSLPPTGSRVSPLALAALALCGVGVVLSRLGRGGGDRRHR